MSVWKSFRPKGTPHPAALALVGEEVAFVSGLAGYRPDGTISDDPAEQGRQAFRNAEAILARQGLTLDEVVWFHPYAVTIDDGNAMAVAVTEAFGEAPPASGALLGDVALAGPGMKIEIEVIAVRGARRELVES